MSAGTSVTRQTGQRVETILEFGFMSQLPEKAQNCPNSQVIPRVGSRQPWPERREGVSPARDLEVSVLEFQGSGDLGQNHSREVERGGEALHSEPEPTEPAGTAIRLFPLF